MSLISFDSFKVFLVVTISIVLLYWGSTLFIPMSFGLLVALVMYPFCVFLEGKGSPRYLAITVCLVIVIALFGALIVLLGWQIQLFRRDLPEIVQRLTPVWIQSREWLQTHYSITIQMQDEWLHNLALNSSDRIGNILNNTFSQTVNTMFMLFLVPIHTALFLYHREVFVKFVEIIGGPRYRVRLRTVMQETVYTYSRFIKGMILVYIIVGTLNSIGLLALGIRHAILFGMLTAIMTIIPYIGIIISSLLPIAIAFITRDSIWYPIGVVGVLVFVQYLEGNIIFPIVVGNQLKVSSWATLVAIVAGGIIWGVAGMILFIPFVAILKVITGIIPEWKGLHVLLDRKD